MAIPLKSLGYASQRMRELSIDPMMGIKIAILALEKELQTQDMMSRGEFVRLRADGKPKQYSVDQHMKIVQQYQDLCEKLLKHSYLSAAPEGAEGSKPVLNINLSDGSQVVIDTDKSTSDPE